MLTSISSKLPILGPPRIVAEVPQTLVPACALFRGCGYIHEAVLTDYVLEGAVKYATAAPGRFVIPVTVDDLAANGLLADTDPKVCWERSVETLHARKSEIVGLAVASDERIEAYILYLRGGEIIALRSVVDDNGTRLEPLLSGIGAETFRLPKVHPEEMSRELLERLGFQPAAGHVLYVGTAHSS